MITYTNISKENWLARFLTLKTEWTTRDQFSRLFLLSIRLDQTEMSTTILKCEFLGFKDILATTQWSKEAKSGSYLIKTNEMIVSLNSSITSIM